VTAELKGCNLLIKVLQEFEDFSFFDAISSTDYLIEDEKKKRFLIDRNNFFLRVLMSFEELNFKIHDLVNTFVMRYTENIPEIEVDFFFLCFLEYKDISEALEIRHNEYFRSLMSAYSYEEGKRFLKNYNPKAYLLKNDENNISSFSINEIEANFVKNVLFSCIRRGFFEGVM
jgi:competence CoiA-like predicted nuclease